MDSALWLGLAGIAGTLIAPLSTTAMTRRGQAAAEDQKARRQAYGTCATELLAGRNALFALRESFWDDDFDQAAAEARMADIDILRADIARSVGAVSVEGPASVAHDAQWAMRTIDQQAGRLRQWLAAVAGGQVLNELLTSQAEYANRDQAEMEQQVDAFVQECRKVLHPREKDWPLPLRYRAVRGLRRLRPW